MKKNKKISLSLNKKVITKLEENSIRGGQAYGISYHNGQGELLYDCASHFGCGPESLEASCPIG
ncbi:class I lanthipeptide [Aquimarina sp. D1M17]|uniref:class I lanthipeptide n=1 Tax=Aquimarina acroporae TaxID=2937283 RepID=UPI0020BFF146|nr:class I lanthipeptide [Aquimarina acroporae]MCK8523502.1 class I lanthipeptide [Aquimarina acroporae]